ncbi:MAG: hypothetical protein CMI96_05880 [Pelagibacteraceae bacterium]|nr:hypothetical protein [Pelagibacteraceae bacterium]|tara:strand:- start:2029 stop:2628 length:600 start_codon:yes stop_codon:yes gene_type:complete
MRGKLVASLLIALVSASDSAAIAAKLDNKLRGIILDTLGVMNAYTKTYLLPPVKRPSQIVNMIDTHLSQVNSLNSFERRFVKIQANNWFLWNKYRAMDLNKMMLAFISGNCDAHSLEHSPITLEWRKKLLSRPIIFEKAVENAEGESLDNLKKMKKNCNKITNKRREKFGTVGKKLFSALEERIAETTRLGNEFLKKIR